MNVIHVVLGDVDKRVTGGVLRGIGYGAIAMLIVTTHVEQPNTVFLPVALLIIGGGMLIDSIARRQNAMRGSDDDNECGERDVPSRELQLRNYVAAELSAHAIEKRYSDDWYAQNPGWWKDTSTNTSNFNSEMHE